MKSLRRDYDIIIKNSIENIDELQVAILLLDDLNEKAKKREEDIFLSNFIFNSNKIEGNTLTLKETKEVLKGKNLEDKPLKDQLEVIGQKEAYEFIKEIVKNKVTIDESVIMHIHSLVLKDRPEDGGIYRKEQVKIRDSEYTPTGPLFIHEEMVKIIDEYNKKSSKYHIIEKIGLFHLKFECIHPFIDGNGRTGRLIINLMLMQNCFPPIIIRFKSMNKYFSGFRAYMKDNDTFNVLDIIIDEIFKSYERISKPRIKQQMAPFMKS